MNPDDTPSPTPATPTPTALQRCEPWSYGDPPPVPDLGEPWWRRAVVYEIFVRSFLDTDGDGLGDLAGITSKLDYIQSLGANTLWLMPIFPSPSQHGYDVTDYEGVDPDYGDEDQLAALLDSAHARGMAVILDLPLNHSSNQHPWFQDALTPDAPKRDYYRWSETYVTTGWHSAAPAGEGYYYARFSTTMPDLNYDTADVRQQMLDVMDGWLWRGVDGFRLDAVRHLIETPEVVDDHPGNFCVLPGLRRSLAQTRPDMLMIGEIWSGLPDIAPYLEDGEDDLLPLVFDFPVAEAMTVGLQTSDPLRVSVALDARKVAYPLGEEQGAPFLSNHDQTRIASALGSHAGKLRLAAGLLYALPGPPIVYYGEELGMTGEKGGTNDNPLRSPMQWTGEAPNFGFTTGIPWYRINPEAATLNVMMEEEDPTSLLRWYQELGTLRATSDALQVGQRTTLPTNRLDALAFMRQGEGEFVLVLANFSGVDSAVAVDLSAVWPEGGWTSAEMMLGENAALTAPVPSPSWTPGTLPPWGIWYLRLR